MPFSRQIRSKSTSIGGCPNRPVNTLPLSVRISSGTPCAAQRRGEHRTHRPWVRSRGISRARHAEPGVVIDPGQRLRRRSRRPARSRPPRPSATAPSAAPRSHRLQVLPPPAAPPPGSISPGRTNARYDRRLDRHRRHTLAGPARSAIRRGPHARMQPRAAPAAAASTSRRHLMRTRPRPMRPVRQPLQPAGLIPATATHAPSAGSPRTAAATSVTVTPIRDHRQHRLIPLLGHAQLPHRRERQGSAEVAVNHQPKHCQASPEADVKHQPKQHISSVGRVGLEPTTQGL